jgi:hypothetical protein
MIFIFMFLKCYYHLYSMTKYEVECVKQAFDEDSNLDFFEQIVNTTKPMKILVTKELLIFRCY